VPAGGHNLVDGARSQARNAKQQLPVGRVDVHGEAVAVLQGPGKLRVDVEVEHAALPARRDLVDAELVVPEQPIGLIKAILPL
jgi:hypothetical protein